MLTLAAVNIADSMTLTTVSHTDPKISYAPVVNMGLTVTKNQSIFVVISVVEGPAIVYFCYQ